MSSTAPAMGPVAPTADSFGLGPEISHRVIAVLEETVEKLSFLGSVMPDVLQHRDELSKFVGDEISRIIQEQRMLEARYEELIAQRGALKGLANKSRYKDVQTETQEVSRALRESTKNLCRSLKDNPNISGNLLKIQRERAEVIELLNQTCREISEVGSFHALITVVEEDRQSQSRQSELVRREKDATQAVKKLDADLHGERAEHSRQVTGHKFTMAELKQTLTTVKSKTTVDVKYSRKEHSARVSSLLRVYQQFQRQMEGQVKDLEQRGEVEAAVHAKTMEYLESKRHQLQNDLDSWEERYSEQYGELEREYTQLTAEREDTLVALEGLKSRREEELRMAQEREAAQQQHIAQAAAAEALLRRQNEAASTISRLFKAFMRRQAELGKEKKGGKKGGKKGKK